MTTTTTIDARGVVRDDFGVIIGHATRGGCENPACRAAIADGRDWHATPRGFAVTLETYHYATSAEACAALLRAAHEHPHALARAIVTTARIRASSGLAPIVGDPAGAGDDDGYVEDVLRAHADGYDWR